VSKSISFGLIIGSKSSVSIKVECFIFLATC
jgi:hypothetical protein